MSAVDHPGYPGEPSVSRRMWTVVQARSGYFTEQVHEGDGVGEQDARGEGALAGNGPAVAGDRDRGGGSDRATGVTDVGVPDGGLAATVMPMADVMADMPGVWRRLLSAHVADRLGRCRGCRSDGGSGERWPCSLHRIAEEAQRLHDQKLARAVDSD
jgi:hypothetical protein